MPVKNIWITSDSHFTHGNFLKFKDKNGNLVRPFDDVNQMDDYMMEKWNSVVKPGDRVYHLGDVTFNYKKFDEVIAPRLHGSKRLILGNHDELGNKILQKHFTKVTLWRVFKEHGFLATHVPLRFDQFGYKGVLNVHGHIHHNLIDDHRFMNACVEHHDYTPIHLDTILKRVADVKEINARLAQEAG